MDLPFMDLNFELNEGISTGDLKAIVKNGSVLVNIEYVWHLTSPMKMFRFPYKPYHDSNFLKNIVSL